LKIFYGIDQIFVVSNKKSFTTNVCNYCVCMWLK